MEQARALQVKAEHDIRHCTTAVGQAAQSLRRIQQEAAEAAENVWRRQLAQHEAAVRREQEAFQAEQVWSESTLPCPGPIHAALSCPALPCSPLCCPILPCLCPELPALTCSAIYRSALPCPAIYRSALPSTDLPCHLQICPALPCPALPCPALPCPALPCPALPCPALPCPANLMQPVPV